MKVVEGLLYTKEHEWLKKEENRVYLGITDFAQNSMGAIVYVELPEVGSEFAEGDTFGVVESVKAASDVYIPLDGKITEVNEVILESPELLNEDPYENWMVCTEIIDDSQLNKLMNALQYDEYCNEER